MGNQRDVPEGERDEEASQSMINALPENLPFQGRRIRHDPEIDRRHPAEQDQRDAEESETSIEVRAEIDQDEKEAYREKKSAHELKGYQHDSPTVLFPGLMNPTKSFKNPNSSITYSCYSTMTQQLNHIL
jgi:hypothetical protein